MKLQADYHTHTIYSKWYHARNTVNQMVSYAQKLGLKELAITDHGPKHLLFGINPKYLDKLRNQINNANNKYNVKVYMGVEANLIAQDGSIDLTDDQINKLDILLMGYHKGTKTDFVKYFFNNTPLI